MNMSSGIWHRVDLYADANILEGFASYIFGRVRKPWIALKMEAASSCEMLLTHIPIYLTSFPKRVVLGYAIWLVGQRPEGISLHSSKTPIVRQPVTEPVLRQWNEPEDWGSDTYYITQRA